MRISEYGYWDRTANIEWCEYILHPYEYSYYIAEFWNTISSLIIVLIGCWEFYRGYFKKEIVIPIITTGLGSAIFHATQSYIGQIIDELSMLLIAFILLHQLRNKKSDMKIINYVQFIAFGLIYFRTLNFVLFLVSFSSLILFIIYYCYHLNKNNNTYRYVLTKGVVGFTIAVLLLWIPERVLCYENSIIDIYHFHALWHLVSIISLRYVLIFTHCINESIVFRKIPNLYKNRFIDNVENMV